MDVQHHCITHHLVLPTSPQPSRCLLGTSLTHQYLHVPRERTMLYDFHHGILFPIDVSPHKITTTTNIKK
jgi:hypothetical protein